MADHEDKLELSEEEFDLWLSPKAAAEVLNEHIHYYTWRPLILKRIEDLDFEAAARKAIYRQLGGEEITRFRERLPRHYWRASAPNRDASFWFSGDITLRIPGRSYHSSDVDVSCVDVRFEPESVRRLIPAASRWKLVPTDVPDTLTRGPPKPARGVPMTFEEVLAWAETLDPRTRALSVRKLWPLAQAAHPGRALPRKLVDPLGQGRGTGPRRKA